MFWSTANLSILLVIKYTQEQALIIPGLPLPTQSVTDFIQPISGTNRNITTDIYYTSISLAENLNANNLGITSVVFDAEEHFF